MEDILKDLESEFGKLNGRFKVVSTIHLKELEEEMTSLRRDGDISEQFYANNLSSFWFEKSAAIPNANSIIVTAIPQRMSLVDFRLNGEHHWVVIPPTYIYEEVRNACTAILSRVFGRTGNKFALAPLPLKLLAVRSGLGKYGRNNISFVEGMGSFHRLEAFYTDYPFREDNWQEKEAMNDCKNCSLCIEACPTKSISAERFLIDAGRCLTNFNENEGDFPAWINPQSHNAIIGCMKCQVVCPMSRELLAAKDRRETFSEEETDAILKGTPKDSLSEELFAKLKRLNMDEYYSLLPRNLALLMK